MMKAMTAAWMLTGCWSAACLAHPAADRIAAAADVSPAGVYAPAAMPRIEAPTVEWTSVAELLSPYRVHPSALDTDWLADRALGDSANTTGTGMGLGYSWRNMKLEGALINMREGREPPFGAGAPKLFTTTTSRLSWRPVSNVTFQLARGHLIRQNNVTDSDDDIHRTSLAASYGQPFHGANWQTTFAVGRTTGRVGDAGSNRVYMLESSMRIAKTHTIFARVERASASELFTDRDALYGQNFNANRLTVGYVYAIPLGARSQMTFGSVASKRTMPQEAASVLGGDSPAYKVFMRLSLQMP